MPINNRLPSRRAVLTAQDLSRLFFHSPTSRPDGVFEPLLCKWLIIK